MMLIWTNVVKVEVRLYLQYAIKVEPKRFAHGLIVKKKKEFAPKCCERARKSSASKNV